MLHIRLQHAKLIDADGGALYSSAGRSSDADLTDSKNHSSIKSCFLAHLGFDPARIQLPSNSAIIHGIVMIEDDAKEPHTVSMVQSMEGLHHVAPATRQL